MTQRFELFQIAFIKVDLFDVLDIALISYVLYKAYLFIRGSRAAQMSVGLVLIFLISLLTQLLNMHGMSWIFEKLETVWLIAFVILFQPELRRMLINVGQSRVIRFFVKVSGTHIVDEVLRGAQELKRLGYGGLIVFVRDTGIKPIIETGLNLQADVSAPLIVSIFNPKSPLHDGAIVVQNEVIAAAKCILPLTQSEEVDPNLGTRHRAAVGLSEESDAIVLVVSEETGALSLASNGRLLSDLDIDTIREMLENALRASSPN
jgi:diadenylate cyclase